MRYPFSVKHDKTLVVTYTDMRHDEHGEEYAVVCVERPSRQGNGRDSLDCVVPGGKCEHIVGFSAQEVKQLQLYIKMWTSEILHAIKARQIRY